MIYEIFMCVAIVFIVFLTIILVSAKLFPVFMDADDIKCPDFADEDAWNESKV